MPAAPRVAETRMLGAAGSGSDVKLAGMPDPNSGDGLRRKSGRKSRKSTVDAMMDEQLRALTSDV